ncbi:MAG: hypothetical protein ACOC8K_04115 [Gemmatimonadota bacterium]
MRRALTGLLGAAVVSGAIWAGYTYVEPRQRARAVQEALRAQRLDADACRRGLVTAEAGFQEYDRRVESLRNRVDRYEALHPDGVPADSFGVYLEAFDDYNDAVEVWEERAENLRRQREACVDIVEAHNELSDSLRGILRELGELEVDENRDVPEEPAPSDETSGQDDASGEEGR